MINQRIGVKNANPDQILICGILINNRLITAVDRNILERDSSRARSIRLQIDYRHPPTPVIGQKILRRLDQINCIWCLQRDMTATAIECIDRHSLGCNKLASISAIVNQNAVTILSNSKCFSEVKTIGRITICI